MAFHSAGDTYVISGNAFVFDNANEAIEAARPDGNVYQIKKSTGKKKIFWKWDAFNNSKKKAKK